MIFTNVISKKLEKIGLRSINLPDTFTILLIPQDSNISTKSFTLSKGVIKIACLTLLSSILIFLVMALFTLNSAKKELKHRALLTEKQSMEEELKSVNKQVETIKSQYEKIKELSEKISEIAEIDISRKGLGIGAIIDRKPGEKESDENVNGRKEYDLGDQSLNYSASGNNEILLVSQSGSLLLNNLNLLLDEALYKRDFLRAIPVNWPTGGMISSPFGYRPHPFNGSIQMHDGLDIAGVVGTPVYATANGVVSQTNISSDYGRIVYINHNRKIQTRYGHLSRVIVKKGQIVKRGEIIAYMGNTGKSTGSHLHYEIRINNIPLDPLRFIMVHPDPEIRPSVKKSPGVAVQS